MRLREVTLQAPKDRFDALAPFYSGRLGLRSLSVSSTSATGEISDQSVSFCVGWSQLSFSADAGDAAPFYHFAFLVPGDRMEEALEWAIVETRLELLALSDDRSDLVIHFEDWDAHSVYFHDPAGNIVELIAHAGFGENGREGAFDGAELLGISEIGLIGSPEQVAAALLDRLGLRVFSGGVDTLAFIGEPTAALILAEEDWGWLPHRRPAEAWPAMVAVDQVASGGWAAAGIHQVEVVESDAGRSTP